MKILVTGGAGFIGSHIVDAYINAGHDVVIIDNLSTGRKQNINNQATFIECDIRDAKLGDIFAQHSFDIVNHQAAQMDVRLSVEDPIYDAENNVIGFLNVMQNCVKHQVKKVIFASSGGVVYGEQDYSPADEDHAKQPCSPYGVTKLAGENYLYYYHLFHNISFTAFRYANVYGPRQNPHGEAGVVAIFLEKMFKGEHAVINGDGEQTRDFVYVKDVARANVLALAKGENRIYNIGTAQETSINTIFRICNQLTGAGMHEKHGPEKSGEQRRSVVAIERAEKELDWHPEYDLESGMKETIDFFKEIELSQTR